MFNWFKRKKEFLSCKWLEHGMTFDHCNLLKVCCAQSHEGGGRYVLKNSYMGGELDWDDIFQQKWEQRKVHRKGKIYEKCKGCLLLEKKEWDDEHYIDTLLLTHWTKCNSLCIYCPAMTDEVLKSTNQHYDVVPALRDMIEKNILRKNTFVSIAGGESTIYPEFEEMLHLLLDYGISDILINTSGIKYSPAIEKGIAEGKLRILVSLDAGTKEIHKKIKSVDSFDKTIENLRRYAMAQNEHKSNVATKYIIVPDINDNQDEIKAWLYLNKDLGIKVLSLDIDIFWHHKNKDNIPQSIYDLVLYAEETARSLDFDLQLYDRAFMVNKEFKKRNNINVVDYNKGK